MKVRPSKYLDNPSISKSVEQHTVQLHASWMSLRELVHNFKYFNFVHVLDMQHRQGWKSVLSHWRTRPSMQAAQWNLWTFWHWGSSDPARPPLATGLGMEFKKITFSVVPAWPSSQTPAWRQKGFSCRKKCCLMWSDTFSIKRRKPRENPSMYDRDPIRAFVPIFDSCRALLKIKSSSSFLSLGGNTL